MSFMAVSYQCLRLAATVHRNATSVKRMACIHSVQIVTALGLLEAKLQHSQVQQKQSVLTVIALAQLLVQPGLHIVCGAL